MDVVAKTWPTSSLKKEVSVDVQDWVSAGILLSKNGYQVYGKFNSVMPQKQRMI